MADVDEDAPTGVYSPSDDTAEPEDGGSESVAGAGGIGAAGDRSNLDDSRRMIPGDLAGVVDPDDDCANESI